ncbi:MAG: hypothetical protein ACOH2M_02015 [Cypionkella sp.]|jgi:propanediol dehydratase large subunit
MRALLALSLILLAACDPQAVADKALRRTAESVVQPVLARELTGAQADAATACVLDAADQEEINMLARDVGVSAGTSTIANIRALALRPAAAACFARSGVPPLRG